MIVGILCWALCAPFNTLAVQPDSHVTFNGTQLGWYVDNEDPTQAQDVSTYLSEGWLVVAGIPPYGPWPRFPGAINAREYYPVRSPRQTRFRPPRARAYILQWRFAWPGHLPPTARQRKALLHLVRLRNPLLVLLY